MIDNGCGCGMVQIPFRSCGLGGTEVGGREMIRGIVQLKEGGCVGVLGRRLILCSLTSMMRDLTCLSVK
jgi:hypothetical protein